MARSAEGSRAEVSVFVATSLDGFIARADGGLDWLERANAAVPPGEDCGYRDFMATVDVLVMGRRTYEQALAFAQWPYAGTPVIALSHRPLAVPAELAGDVSASSEAPIDLVARLSAGGARRVYVDGGDTVRRFLAAGLVDELTITVIPVLLGDGVPLFGALGHDVPLALLTARSFDFGFVQLTYRVSRGAAHPAPAR